MDFKNLITSVVAILVGASIISSVRWGPKFLQKIRSMQNRDRWDKRRYRKALRKGIDSAWKEFIDEHYELIFSICIVILQNEQESHDMTNDVFSLLFEKLTSKQKKNICSLKNYLTGIARNKCIEQRRKESKRFLSLQKANEKDLIRSQQEVLSPDDELAREEMVSIVEKLDGEEYDVVYMCFYLQMSISEISKEIGISEYKVRLILKRALDRIRKRFE